MTEAPTSAPALGAVERRLHAAGLAVLRVVMGMVWLAEAWWKFPPEFGIFRSWVERPLEYPVWEPYNVVVEQVILPNFTLFAWAVFFTEAFLAGFLIVGLLTRLWAVVGLAMTVPIIFSVIHYTVTGDAGTISEWNWAYYMMLGIHAALFATAAGRSYGVDGVMRPHWAARGTRLTRLLARLS